MDGVLVLLDELTEQAPKAARSAVDALAEMQRREVLADVLPWLDLGVAISADSGALALRFFKESPLLLGLLDPSKRKAVLETGLELADRSANVAVEFIRIAPEAVGVLPSADWSTWMELACELAETDFALAVEYIRQIPSIAPVLSLDGVRSWVQFGTKLIVENSLGKPDYLGALEFFRTSPAILDDIPGAGSTKRGDSGRRANGGAIAGQRYRGPVGGPRDFAAASHRGLADARYFDMVCWSQSVMPKRHWPISGDALNWSH